MVFVDRDVLRPHLAVGETHAICGLRTRKHHLRNTELHCSVDHVVRTECVHSECLVVGPDQDGRHRGEVNDGVIPRYTGAGFEFIVAGVRRQRVEYLTGIGEVDPQVGHASNTGRDKVDIGDLVPAFDEVLNGVTAGLATAAGEEDSHSSDRSGRNPRELWPYRGRMAANVVLCPSCSAKNRVPAASSGKPTCAKCHANLPWLVDATDADFAQVTDTSRLVLVDLWAPWCGPCRMVAPILETLSRDFAGTLKVVKVNVDGSPTISQRFNASSIPMLVFLRDGAVVDTVIGAQPEHVLRSAVERLAATS